jgi:insertion element IS1 protein InsB
LVFRSKKQKCCQPHELIIEDCWIGMTQAGKSGLIIATRVGKHTDEFISQLVVNTEDKTDCHQWHTGRKREKGQLALSRKRQIAKLYW